MIIELINIDKEEILKKINEYIDTHEDKKIFNEELKKIFKLNKILSDILINYTIEGLLYFENQYSSSTGTTKKIISELINSINIKTGEKIYEYKFDTINKENKIISFIDIHRKDKKEDLYSYRIKEIFEQFSKMSEKSDKYFYESISNLIDKAYEYTEFYIDNIQQSGIEFDENKFISELIYLFVQADANEVYKEYRETYKK